MHPILPILFKDDYLVAIHKPAGLLVHRTEIARGQDDTFVVQLVRDQIGQYVYPLHRLDRPTSGVLLLAIDPEANRQLKEDFTERRVAKRYIALVRGWLEGPGEIDYPLAKPEFDRRKARKKRERGEVPEKQPAVTTFKPLDNSELPIPVGRYETARYSLVELSPKTGRTHQLRRHMGHLRHPIIGDKRYGDRHHNRMFAERLELPGLFLTALSLTFTHPVTKEPIEIKTDLEPRWQATFAALSMDAHSPITNNR